MRDMVPKGDRSIRNIPLPQGHRAVRVTQQPQPESEQPMYEEDFTAPPRKPRKGIMKSRLFLVIAAVVLLCGIAGVLMSTMFAGATVSVAAKSATVTAPATVGAQINAPAQNLAYQVISSNRTASTTVPTTGTQKVSRSASGMITIYNAFSNDPQELINNTRFESEGGHIYRIHAPVTIPGQTKGADGVAVPGTVTVMVYADKPGADYNLNSGKLTIPGFKGSGAKYEKIFAQATGIANGFVGDEPAASKADLANAEQALKQALSNAMNEMLQTQVPKEFLAVPGTLQIAYNDIVQSPGPNNTAILSQTANATANVIRLDDLAAAIARQTVQGYNGEALTFKDKAELSIALATSSGMNGPITLALSGNPTLVWQFDSNSLKQAVVGKSKKDFETILKSFTTAIQCSSATPCKASIRPFWSGTFPSDPEKIKVINETLDN